MRTGLSCAPPIGSARPRGSREQGRPVMVRTRDPRPSATLFPEERLSRVALSCSAPISHLPLPDKTVLVSCGIPCKLRGLLAARTASSSCLSATSELSQLRLRTSAYEPGGVRGWRVRQTPVPMEVCQAGRSAVGMYGHGKVTACNGLEEHVLVLRQEGGDPVRYMMNRTPSQRHLRAPSLVVCFLALLVGRLGRRCSRPCMLAHCPASLPLYMDGIVASAMSSPSRS